MCLQPFKDIYGILDMTYTVVNFIGLAPYERIVLNKKAVYLESENKYFISICESRVFVPWLTGICVLLTIGLVMVSIEEHYRPMHDAIQSGLFYIIHLQLWYGGVFTLLTFAQRFSYFLEALRIIDEVDQQLKNKKMPVSYKEIYFTTLLAMSMFPVLSIAFVSYDEILSGKSFYTNISEDFAYGLPFSILNVPAFYYILIQTSIRRRLALVNHYLKKLNFEVNAKRVEEDICAVADIHFKLCTAANFTTYTFAINILCFYTLTFFHLLLVLLYFITGFIVKFFDFEVKFFFVCYSCTLMSIVITTELLKHEEAKTGPILCDITTPFFHSEVALRRNTFLFQLLQIKLNFNLGGFFQLSLQTILANFATLTNLVMFISQLRRAARENTSSEVPA